MRRSNKADFNSGALDCPAGQIKGGRNGHTCFQAHTDSLPSVLERTQRMWPEGHEKWFLKTKD